MEKICIHAFVSGRVQGVFFRDSTKKQAEALGITGWTRNLADGRVEVFACGEKSQLEQLQSWLAIGPSAAQVDQVEVKQVAYETHETFVVLRSVK